ncbi:helix-turn-helix domain-containing protein [Confluentibacter flavum]|uniref:Helicase n=1 Tax=Confluentibacter flavum TaxID=1909700 RepID=A0A2N3HJ85_9FLAO|nr:helix-turn-helix domain-containing protein [Confluentibacter flavum]PKQ45016.1 helicase [Confluentibacter flavum]
MPKNIELELAWDFVEKTDRNVFLTGKAGTGKTTFLHKLKEKSFKRLVVVAPTGVAAINAKGVTIHSFFQMAFGPILPEEAGFHNKESGFQRKFNKTKIDIIKSLDLLIIDEISMVRADLLDGIDAVLKRYKDRTKVFGGVQVLMIGDLQQLSPVVKDNEWDLLKPYYETPYFFSSKVFKSCNPISIELKHIYRQDNEVFIKILNEIRNNKLTNQSATLLNKRYIADFVPAKNDGYITLTTHNNRANEMNNLELQKIKDSSYFYKAEVDGNFPEYSYPTHETLELKKGAQVMFVKNDSTPEKRYFNGKIGKIIHLDKEEIKVRCQGDDFDIVVTPELWENINYSIDPETKKISETVVGAFSQMPLRLAWAITIHKSQGLTFEKAIIDAQASFAHGQTYVALSRCKTLEGIVLKHPINKNSIINDLRVTSFTETVENNPPSETVLNESQKKYQLSLIEELLNYYAFLQPVNRILDVYYKNSSSIKGHIVEPLTTIKEEGITKLLKLNTSFMAQLKALSVDVMEPEKNTVIQERINKALAYFTKHTEDFIKTPLNTLTFATENKDVDKEINKHLDEIEEQLATKLYCLNGLKEYYSSLTYLEIRAKSVLQKSKTTPIKIERKDTTEHPILFEQLKALRTSFADAENVPPYVIFTQKSLYDLCEMLPTNNKQLLAVNGMGKVRVEKYGMKILDIIKAFCDANSIDSNTILAKKEKPKKEDTKKVSLDLFKRGLSISEIAKERNFVETTIQGHLVHFIPTGEVKITDLMPEEKYEELKIIIQQTTFDSLTELKNKIDDKFTYNEMRMVANNLELL